MDITNKLIGAVGIVIITIILLALTNTIVSQVQALAAPGGPGQTWVGNATHGSWVGGWNFTGYVGAKQLVGLVPFVWISSILICASVGMYELARA